MGVGIAANGQAHGGMPVRRAVGVVAACLLLGLLINFAVAAALGARRDRGPAPTGFGFVGDTFAPSVNWCGGVGRDLIAIASDPGLDGATRAALDSRFRTVFGAPNGSMSARDLDTWSARLFPRWGDWAYRVTSEQGARRVYAAGFPLRSFAGYDTGAHVSFSFPKPAAPFRQVGFLWRDRSSPIRAVVYMPLALGATVNSLVYATPLAAVAFLPMLRRSIRVRRGRCPQCTYDLRSDFAPGCPECGWGRLTRAPEQPSRAR